MNKKKRSPPCRFGHHVIGVWSREPRKQLLSSASKAWVDAFLGAERAGALVEVPGGWLIEGHFSDALPTGCYGASFLSSLTHSPEGSG